MQATVSGVFFACSLKISFWGDMSRYNWLFGIGVSIYYKVYKLHPKGCYFSVKSLQNLKYYLS